MPAIDQDALALEDDSAAGMRAISTDVAFLNLEFRQAGVKFYGVLQ